MVAPQRVASGLGAAHVQARAGQGVEQKQRQCGPHNVMISPGQVSSGPELRPSKHRWVCTGMRAWLLQHRPSHGGASPGQHDCKVQGRGVQGVEQEQRQTAQSRSTQGRTEHNKKVGVYRCAQAWKCSAPHLCPLPLALVKRTARLGYRRPQRRIVSPKAGAEAKKVPPAARMDV